MKGMILRGNMEQAIQVYVYAAIGCVPAVFVFCKLWTALIVHDAIRLYYILLLLLLAPNMP